MGVGGADSRLTQSHLDMLVFKNSAEDHTPLEVHLARLKFSRQDAFQYLVENVRRAEESGETEQAGGNLCKWQIC